VDISTLFPAVSVSYDSELHGAMTIENEILLPNKFIMCVQLVCALFVQIILCSNIY